MKTELKAFTLIETLIAVTFTTVVITAVAGLILTTLFGNQRNLHQVQALYLAQETLEAMRFIRDSNGLQNYAWDGGAGLWGADFNLSPGDSRQLFLKEEACPPCFSFSSLPQDGLVPMDKGMNYLRSVTIHALENVEEQVEVTALVEWNERGRDRSLNVSTYLSDWK